MAFGKFDNIFENFNGKLNIYVSGSQGVAPASWDVEYGVNFSTINELNSIIAEFLDEVAEENYIDYLDDCDGDSKEAFMECLSDSGDVILTIPGDDTEYWWDFGTITKLQF